MKAKVSIIVPVYNVEQYLPACLDSLVNQTLKDIEIIVVNDGSPDNSQQIIDQYAKDYPNTIKAFKKENGGLSDARNYGVQLATGEYLAFVDSDDYVACNMYELMYSRAVSELAEVVVCNYFSVDEDLKEKEINNITNPDVFNQGVEDSPEILLQSKSYAWNKIYNREWYQKNGFSFPKGQWFEDSAVIYNMLYMAKDVSCVNECLYYYRDTRPNSITNTLNSKMFDIFISCSSIHTFYYSHTQKKAVLDVADRVCQIHLFVRFRHLYKAGSLKIKISFYRRMLEYFDRYMPQWTKNPYFIAAPKKPQYMRFIHIPWLMISTFFIPNRILLKMKNMGRKS